MRDENAPLYCDNHVAVFVKKSGETTQSQEQPEKSLEYRAKKWIKEEFNKPGNVFLESIHRLDKPVSGLVVFARTSKALSRLQKAMRERKISKTYTALCEGFFEKKEDTLTHYLDHGDYKAIISKNGKKAILHYSVLKQSSDAAIVEVQLETGRYHQIRVQLSTIKHPIIGDVKYGSKQFYRKNSIALIHSKVTFPHPVKTELITVDIEHNFFL